MGRCRQTVPMTTADVNKNISKHLITLVFKYVLLWPYLYRLLILIAKVSPALLV